jgi:hypothetical protein
MVMRSVHLRALALASWLAAAAGVALLGCGSSSPSCPSGQLRCGGQCVDAASDGSNCGACGIVCARGASCLSGACACPAGQIACGGACVDTQASALHCGACNQPCGLGSCVDGRCVCDTAPATVAACAGFPACVDLASDRAHCGSCTTPCTRGGEVCSTSTCTCPPNLSHTCPEGAPAGSGACVNLAGDAKNCGTCGTFCLANETCAASACVCLAPFTACPSIAAPTSCVDAQTDPSNCGACGHACGTGQTCAAGKCVCPAGKTVCGQACVDTQADPANCGRCGAACPAGAPACLAATCCAGGAALCSPGGTCPLAHSNGIGLPGLGQLYFDCSPFGDRNIAGTFTQAMAVEAARAWAPDGVAVTGCANCISLQKDTLCGTWCWDGGVQGLVSLLSVCGTCPTFGAPFTTTWN